MLAYGQKEGFYETDFVIPLKEGSAESYEAAGFNTSVFDRDGVPDFGSFTAFRMKSDASHGWAFVVEIEKQGMTEDIVVKSSADLIALRLLTASWIVACLAETLMEEIKQQIVHQVAASLIDHLKARL